jgi:murein DD-endopeptidase MepM/ murein hydrolase activator NlpD
MVTPPSFRARRRLGWVLMCLGAGGALAAGALAVSAQRGAAPVGAQHSVAGGASPTARAVVVATGSAPALAPIRPRLVEGSVIAHVRLGGGGAPLTVVEGRAQPGTLGHDASTAYPGEPHSMLLVAGAGLSVAAPGDGSEMTVVASYGVYRYRVVETHVVGDGSAAGPQVPGLRLVVAVPGGTRVTSAELLAQDPDGQAELSQETAVALAQASFGASAGTAAPAAGRLLWPCTGPITQPFGPSAYGFEFPYVYQGVSYPHFHTGVDVGVGLGTPISAAADGVVVLAGTNVVGGKVVGYGTYVVIAHGGGLYTLYGHLSRLEVAAGDHVRAGQVIGLSGSTGNSTGPHLHFEVRVGAEPVDPRPYLR